MFCTKVYRYWSCGIAVNTIVSLFYCLAVDFPRFNDCYWCFWHYTLYLYFQWVWRCNKELRLAIYSHGSKISSVTESRATHTDGKFIYTIVTTTTTVSFTLDNHSYLLPWWLDLLYLCLMNHDSLGNEGLQQPLHLTLFWDNFFSSAKIFSAVKKNCLRTGFLKVFYRRRLLPNMSLSVDVVAVSVTSFF